MKQILHFFCLIFITGLQAQSVLFDQYFNNNYLINPAITGIEQYIDVQLGTRQQWTGVTGAPQTGYLTIHGPINGAHRRPGFSRVPSYQERYGLSDENRKKVLHGVGGLVIAESIGPFKRQEANLSYAIHVPISTDVYIAFGSAGGLRTTQLDRLEITTTSVGDPIIDNFSNELAGGYKLGIWIHGKSFYMGFSRSEFGGSQPEYFATSGYRIPLRSGNMGFMPFGVLRVADELNHDYGIKVDWKMRIATSLIYQTTSRLGWSVTFNANPLFGITYLYTNHLDQQNEGFRTHEISLNFRLNNQNKILCPEEMW